MKRETREKLSNRIVEELKNKYGKRGEKAVKLVEEGRVKKYRDFFIVVSNDEYVVEDEFCTCEDFEFRKKECSHILAVKIARETGNYDSFDIFYMDLNPDFLKRRRK